MDPLIRRPEEILAYRPLRQILDSRFTGLRSVGPADTVLTAVQLMADKDIGFLPVLRDENLVGVLSERDCARRVLAKKKSAEATRVEEVMTREVVTANLADTFADCLRLMHQHAIRHLPVLNNGKVTAVVSVRDLLSETVAHHAKIIAELERERLTIFTSTA